ncbi:hypothetical protein ACFFIX_19675 [Metabacillus herbersteinensis]|uniref:Uncharacterized protein n=1 Tax=Metabacillus herbersteinensis TaxID=283816 RepID=A0ABV6GIV4_9BACI
MQKESNKDKSDVASNTEVLIDDVSKNRSIRWSDTVYDQTRSAATSSGKTLDELQRELLALRARISLETDHEFGSQIQVVNELLQNLGERFSSMVSHANTKIQIQETTFEKYKLRSEVTVNDLQDKVDKFEKHLKEVEEEKGKLLEEAKSAKVDKWKAEEALKKQQTDSDERIGELKESISEKDDKIVDKNEKIDRLEKEIDSMQKSVSKNQELQVTVETLINDLELGREKHENDLISLRKELEQQHVLALKNLELEIQTSLQNEFRITLEEKLEDYDTKREQLRNELREKYESQIHLKNEELYALKQEIKEKSNVKNKPN